MHSKNCLTCKNSRIDFGMFTGPLLHCEKENIHPKTGWWFYRQQFKDSQIDMIFNAGCGSWESNQ